MKFRLLICLLCSSLLLCACSSLQNILPSSVESTSENSVVTETAADRLLPETQIQSKPAPDNLLNQMATEFQWDTHASDNRVQRQIEKHLRNPKHFQEILARSQPYLHLINDALKKRNLPSELAFLPFVESGYEANSFSHRGAAGLWQFMPPTARHMGLNIDWWHDERLDVAHATAKALDYLEYLHKRFDGDWALALAAYNGGEGYIAKQIRRSGKTDFWSLRLKRETQEYVPKLLAVVEIIKRHQDYAVQLPKIPLEASTQVVLLEQQIDLRLAAQHIGMSYADLQTLNPSYKRWATPPQYQPHILLPTDKISYLEASLGKIKADERLVWDRYRVEPGDNLILIARKFGTTARALMAINQIKGSRIYANQDLLVPKVDGKTASMALPANTQRKLYVVQSGDSLWKISRRQQVSSNDIRRLNNLKNDRLRIGQVLILSETYASDNITYEVQSGDSLSRIASRFKVNISDLRSWNALSGDLIKPGQELTIRPGNS